MAKHDVMPFERVYRAKRSLKEIYELLSDLHTCHVLAMDEIADHGLVELRTLSDKLEAIAEQLKQVDRWWTDREEEFNQ